MQTVQPERHLLVGHFLLLRLLNFHHGELPIDTIRHETHAVAGLDRIQHRRIGGAEDHGHALVHVEFPRQCNHFVGEFVVSLAFARLRTIRTSL
jgi:hypothetical protein